jgi:kynurenine formamidase
VRVVDLSHHYEDGMPIFPGLPGPSFRPIAKVEDDGYAMSEYHLLNHIGTHVDAPAHQIAGGDTLDEIGLERLVTDAVTIDVSRRTPGPIAADELAPELDRVQRGDIVSRTRSRSRSHSSRSRLASARRPQPRRSMLPARRRGRTSSRVRAASASRP